MDRLYISGDESNNLTPFGLFSKCKDTINELVDAVNTLTNQQQAKPALAQQVSEIHEILVALRGSVQTNAYNEYLANNWGPVFIGLFDRLGQLEREVQHDKA